MQRTLRQSGRVLNFELLSKAEVSHFDNLGSVGGKVWPSASQLISYMETRHADVKGKHILELGSGCGYCGISLGSLGAGKVSLTDMLISQGSLAYDSEGCLVDREITPSRILLDLCTRNVDINKKHIQECEMNVYEVKWGKQSQHTVDALLGNEDYFDMIVGSDLTYYPDATESLFWTVSYLLRYMIEQSKISLRTCTFITAHQKRRGSAALFALECAQRQGLGHRVLLDDNDFIIWEFFRLHPK